MDQEVQPISPVCQIGLRRASPVLLQEGWVIANHILVSFHVAFISSVLSLSSASLVKSDVLLFIFVSPETLISALFMYISFHTGIAVHEMGHYLAAARLNALNERSQRESVGVLRGSFLRRAVGSVRLFLLAPYGKASGIKREGLNYYPDAPYNLAVAAAGPRASRNLSLVALSPAVILLALGIGFDVTWAVYGGRLCLGMGVVGLLDFLLADPGKYGEFKNRERSAQEKAASVTRAADWWSTVAEAKQKMLDGHIQKLIHPRLGPVIAPWQYRNCGMGGRHTEKEYPESNISMQEAMFLILGARDYQEAQEMTVRLQNRLKEIIESEEGCRVMGIGLEGGLAPYVERGRYPMPEVRLWAMMKQAIKECGYQPGVDVAIALDPAMSELEIAYRKQFNVPDSIGMYLFWRDKTLTVMDRDSVLELYLKAIKEYDIPILSIEDGFSENDYEGWQKLLKVLGDRVFVIGDDLVTTNDRTIELAASNRLINTVLIKANQIGTLYETILAMLVSLGKGLELVVSHRSKSPNDDMEAQIALAVNSLGLKAGGGANTERLVKYHAINELMQKGMGEETDQGLKEGPNPVVRKMFAYEEPTNAGIPSVGTTVELVFPKQGLHLKFKGATPLGTSAGAGEAIHLVDSAIESAEHREVIERHSAYFRELEPNVFCFDKQIKQRQIKTTGDDDLLALFNRAQRYGGKGCLNAVDNVTAVIAPVFEGMSMSGLKLIDIDRILLSLEVRVARRRGKLAAFASNDERILVMQRKQNLGMNAILSVSLAMARAVAHLQGKALFEILREEMFSIIERLAGLHKVEIKGSSFSDYAAALWEVNRVLESEGKLLYETLREMTGIYSDLGADAKAWRVSTKIDEGDEVVSVDNSVPVGESFPRHNISAPPPLASTAGDEETPVKPITLTKEEEEQIVRLNRRLREVCSQDADNISRREVLRQYISIKQAITKHAGKFGLVNNRVYLASDDMLIPYILQNRILLYRTAKESAEPVVSALPGGTIITDELVKRLARFEGEAIDLENELFELDTALCRPVHISRVQDMAEQLGRIGKSVSRNDALYLLRILVARLSLFSFKKYLTAKNLQTEVHNLTVELMHFLNAPLSDRVPFLARILVRNISGVVTKPKLIDRLWNDTIDLAEVHLRGSDIVNEIRRSTHHAVGKRTLTLVQSYLEYLESGNIENLARLGYPDPAPADEEARKQDRPKQIVASLLNDLEELLGSSDIVTRIREWQATYSSTLVRCESENSLLVEVGKVLADSIRERNRWAYYHHLRIIKNRVNQFPLLTTKRSAVENLLQELLALKPDEVGSDAQASASQLERCVKDFVSDMRAVYQEELFRELENLSIAFDRKAYYEVFSNVFELRKGLRIGLNQRAFPEQRLLLYELDCLLEEMGYVTMRHIASRYEEEEVELRQCLQVIRGCAMNLTHDGVHSRQLLDLVEMLNDGTKTYAELDNILQQIQRNYQHILRRLIGPFEKMRDRLELDEEELRISLANMQRFMHDLNSMASFADMARSHIEHKIKDTHARLDGEAAVSDTERGSMEIIHLSHGDQIWNHVHSADPIVNPRGLYGGKGSGLIYISYMNIPTPDGFILPVTISRRLLVEPDDRWLEGMIREHIEILEADISKCKGAERKFCAPERPLLLAVRGGSPLSMPGILPTVIFVGMNDEITEALAVVDPWHAYDSYRRFLASYAGSVWGVDIEKYNLVEEAKKRHGVMYKYDLSWEAMRDIAESTKNTLRKEGFGEALEEILADPWKQLFAAVRAVFDSWNGETATRYRELTGISDGWLTAVIVQQMASGNRQNEEIRIRMDETKASLTGVIPKTVVTELGARKLTGEFKFSASGEDLVGGLTTSVSFRTFDELESLMPMLNRRLRHTITKLRRFMGTDQEIEFTVDRGVLSVLQSRAAQIGTNRNNFSFIDPGEETTRGIGIRGSAFRGLAAFDEADYDALRAMDLRSNQGVDGIMMILENPTPADMTLVLSCEGMLASKGGSTSHAAIAVNGIEGKDYSAVMSAVGLRVNAHKHQAEILDEAGNVRARIQKGDVVSIHGTTGAIYLGTRNLQRA